MLMLATPSEDGLRLRFFAAAEDVTAKFAADEEQPPSVWLTAEQATEDSNYWPEDSAFLAEVVPRKLGARAGRSEVARSSSLTPHCGSGA